MKRTLGKARESRGFNLFYLPALLLIAFFIIYPFCNAVYVSFFKWNGYSSSMKYVGFKNYLTMFSDSVFKKSFENTLIYGFGSSLIDVVFGLMLALFLNQRFPGGNLVRAIIYLPVLISGLVMGYIMYFIFQYSHGALNDVMLLAGAPMVDWLADSKRSVLIITLINSWQFVGNTMLIFLAGLQGIPVHLYEAAELDGADAWHRFSEVTLPLLMPSTTSAVTLNLIGGLKLYEIIVALTGGGPAKSTHSLSSFIENQYFSAEKAGYAAAVGVFSFIFIMIIANISNSWLKRKERKLL
ncbi:MAG: sugar ABC transporter permease [Clostridia bacterium]|nr:sugar ABC transporter permease [Clostridia bacterium]